MAEIDPDKVAAREAEVAASIERGRQAGRRLGLGCLLMLPVLVALSCAGGGIYAGYLGLVADATFIVQNPGGRALVFVDDALVATLDGQQIERVRAPRGRRTLRIVREGLSREWTRDVTGFDELLVSTDPGVCFAQLNVGRALYGSASARRRNTGCGFGARDVDLFMTCREPCDIGTARLSIAELPDEVESGHSVTLMVPFPCAQSAPDPAQLLGRLVGCVP